MANSDIVGFYRDRSIFITGATGFMGKVLVEKLLRCCPGVKTLYLLMRPKAGNDIRTRLEELVSTKVRHFKRLCVNVYFLQLLRNLFP